MTPGLPPVRSPEWLEGLLALCRGRGSSDLHLSAGMPPFLRRHGRLGPVEGPGPLEAGDAEALALSLMGEARRGEFARRSTVDFAHASPSGGRFRVNVFRQRRGVALSFRRIEDAVLDLSDWNLPAALGDLVGFRDGLVVVTGPVGSGKTTTLAALVHRLVRRAPCHVVTVEDPVEYLLSGPGSLVHQREVGADVPSFAEAVRAALREDPDALLVGEMRDLETMRAALTAAETGHLVLATLHTGDAVGAVERVVGMYPAAEKDAVRHQLSMVLRAVAAQRLLPRRDGEGRVPAVELLRVTPGVAHLVRTGRTEQVATLQEAGAAAGMWTLEQDLARLAARGAVAEATARRHARDGESFEAWLRAARAAPAASGGG